MTPEQAQALLPGCRAAEAWGRTTVEVDRVRWTASVTAVRDAGWDYFDTLVGVDEQAAGIDVVVHLWSLAGRASVLLRTRLPADDPKVDSLAGVFAGAAWHERELAEMFGVRVVGHPGLAPLLLAEGFAGAPLRKDFVLASRVARPWPGAPEPGQSSAEAATGRRKVLPPGVPAPGTWPAGERA